MISEFDIQKLQDLAIEDVAEKLDLTVKRHKALCPFHTDSHPSLTFNRSKNRYRCYVCGASGGPIDLVINTQGWKFHEACKWLAHEFNIILSDDNDWKPQQIKQQPKVRPSREDLGGSPDIPYLTRLMAQPIINEQAAKFLYEERKIRPEVVKQLGISSISYNCPMSSSPKPTYFDGPALLIPYRDINGNLVSVQSRYLGNLKPSETSACPEVVEGKPSETGNGIPRFRFPRGSTCHIFNMDVLRTMKAGEPLFLTEGVSDCLAILSAGFKAIAIPSATLLKKEDTELLKGFTLHIYPDKDEAGESLYLQLLTIFPNITRHNLPAGFKDVGQYYSFIHKDDKPYAYRTNPLS